MNWHQIEVHWDKMSRQLKSQWGKLTDDDLEEVAGKKEQLVERVQQRYGLASADAERQVDEWVAKVSPLRRGAPDKPMRG